MPAYGQFTAYSKGAKCIEVQDFEENIETLLSLLSSQLGSVTYFSVAKKKSQACKRKIVSKRRSQYTGVTKNSSNYQALIVINGKKTYVGSYTQEILAAITFDFYSMLLHNKKAMTNFSYTADDVLKMVENFRAHGNKFNPYDFVGVQN
uniref:Uncharacterized protein n=1 Tax=Euplotes harpa TaxID=151035 RepID=A0A7S3J000_9SPIT|mmetsp:Transcript_12120/g.13813  ORF Transcript_12120/g.13813 Transcript_12120/m.13813 type:complete len:149 (+) Transcript_12120:49-495(+)|eukprot:CAMPEP_0168336452 /NCGR_PEP_ID=MMETSP0213-20121227/11549_1 /TAXON_ID=151035 /ORGANISM="Euplotes harpa, Strain FSP1.4" /LENGTH=148 /DNA_ID=CAMNT_0008341645 /DNA_START=177 /DNA_END=623 /DNA_ORIENTATION=+